MWMLNNITPFEAERTWVREKDGAHHWIVVVKATYDIRMDGSLCLSENPVAPLYAAEFNGENGQTSLRFEADLIAMKPATDVYLNANAYAPDARPCTKVNVSLRISGLYKELIVYGHRTWQRSIFGGLVPSSPKPFKSRPIIYEYAYGGYDPSDPNPQKQCIDYRNPVGTGVAMSKRSLLAKSAPSIENPTLRLGKGWPAGFGAIASYWSPRKELAGTYDEAWMARRRPLLPLDYNPKWLLCSPLDQQIHGYLKGGEPVELINLTPNGRLRFTLPKVDLYFETYFGTTRKEHTAELVTITIESEGPRLIMVWQTSLPCGNDGDYLDRTVIQYETRSL